MGLLTAPIVQKFEFHKSTILRTVKSPYICSRLTDFDEIWHNDAHWPPTAEFEFLKIQHGGSRHLQISQKSRYIRTATA